MNVSLLLHLCPLTYLVGPNQIWWFQTKLGVLCLSLGFSSGIIHSFGSTLVFTANGCTLTSQAPIFALIFQLHLGSLTHQLTLLLRVQRFPLNFVLQLQFNTFSYWLFLILQSSMNSLGSPILQLHISPLSYWSHLIN